MIVLKILAAPLVVALTLLVAIVSFLYCVASALCHMGCMTLPLLVPILFIGGQTLGDVVLFVLTFLVFSFAIPAIADWLVSIHFWHFTFLRRNKNLLWLNCYSRFSIIGIRVHLK